MPNKYKLPILLTSIVMLLGLISTTVNAQQGSNANQQATLLLEMQALRAEIAELRDMVERQGFQIRRMQSSANQVSQAPATPQYSAPVTPSQNASVGQTPSSDVGAPRLDSNGLPSSTGVADATANNQARPARIPESESEFYQPYDGQANSGLNEPATGANQAEVVDALPGARAAESTYPPVVERQVGAGASSAAGQINDSQAILSNGRAPGAVDPNQAIAPSQESLPSEGLGSVPSPIDLDRAQTNQKPASGGIIAIPQAGSNSNQGVPTPDPTSSPITADQVASAQASNAYVAPAPVVIPEEDFYQQGFELLKQSKHAQAVDTFKQQIANYPEGKFADDAHYWIAESMYVNRSLDNSKLYFKAIIDNFAQSPRLPDAMLKTAYIEQEQGNQIEARILLQEIIQYHPRSNAAISAKNRLAEIE